MTAICAAVALALLEGLQCPPPPPPVDQMRLYATSYNWELGGINCDGDCAWTAIDVATHPALLGHTAACPEAWLGRINTTVITLHDGSEWWCVDNFGAPENRIPVLLDGEWLNRVDFAVAVPAEFAYNQERLSGWTMEWRPLREMYSELFSISTE